MRLFSGKVPIIAEEIVQQLGHEGDVEFDSVPEARLDIEAVLREYLRLEREVMDEAKRRSEVRGFANPAPIGKVRAQVAKERGAPPADEILPYLLNQILQMLFHSSNVGEVFADDVNLRKKITAILRRNMEVENELDREVRSKIRNLQEGTATFELEYSRLMEQLQRSRGLKK